jgi:hypothetical protein
MKGSIKVGSTLLTVIKKLVLDSKLEVTRHTTAFPDHVVKIHRDGVTDLVEDDDVHPNPPESVGGVLSVTCLSRA